ncbi:MAG: hypothetical protein HN590_03385 [Calditrichaeota bacterium]|jgi:hypothetical protein|nr:hypothetical protein [Calditrichota bacterium]MBT7788146.1 hypothetical protein [Calditrichota bacterium]
MDGDSINQLKSIEFTGQNLILCEGKTDKDFFEILIHRNPELNSFKEEFQIEPFFGVDNFREYVTAIRVSPGLRNLKSILVVGDFDDGRRNRFDSFRNALSDFNLPSPDKLGKWTAGSLCVQIYLFPNNESIGMLESLCWDSIGNTDLRDCVSKYEECIEATGITIKNVDKMRMFSYIAAHSNSCNVGVAAKYRIIDVKSEVFSDIKRVLMEMVNS